MVVYFWFQYTFCKRVDWKEQSPSHNAFIKDIAELVRDDGYLTILVNIGYLIRLEKRFKYQY